LRIGLIAAPFIAVPPAEYGGTELFVAHLAEGLRTAGVSSVVYANGESNVRTDLRWLYERSHWPIKQSEQAWLKELEHTAWAIQDAVQECDLIHVQSAQALTFSRFAQRPFVLTLHGPHEPYLSDYYAHYPEVQYVSISKVQAQLESMPKLRTIHHGIDLTNYRLVENKQHYVSFIGRIAPIKGTHTAIDVAQRTGIPLKIAGEVQPAFREYFEKKIKPHIDGSLIEYIGPADLPTKNELLGNSMAMLFPIQWNEPFGLVMLEAMACGTPVLAMPGGSVCEVVQDGVCGYVCHSVRSMAKRLMDLKIDAGTVRRYVEENFSIDRMVQEYVRVYKDSLQLVRRDKSRGAYST